MVLKSDIRDAAYFAFRKSQIKAMMIERLDCIHVSDLIKPCMRNVIYNKETPEHSIDTEKMRPLFLGQAIHEVTDMSTPNIQGLPVTHELPLYYNWLHKSPCKKEDILNAVNKYDYITGKIDDIIEVNGELVICDKKTTGSIDYFKSRDDRNQGPNDSHRMQINIYATLLKICYNVDVCWGCNIYYPTKLVDNKKEFIVPIPYKLEDKDKTYEIIQNKAILIKEFMEKKILPIRTKCYLCDGMCDHAAKCFMDDRVKW